MIPENISELTTEELEAKATELRQEFDKAYADEAPLEELAPLADAIKAIDTEVEARREADAEAAEQRAALAESIRPATPAEEPESVDAEQDELYDQAVAFVTESRRASISSVQRQLRIGYNRAARLVEEMEAAGVVSPPEHNGQREVLAPPPPRD